MCNYLNFGGPTDKLDGPGPPWPILGYSTTQESSVYLWGYASLIKSICHWYQHTSHNSSSDRKFGSLELFPRPLPSFLLLVDVFHGGMASLPEGKSRGLFSAAVCKIQASKCYVEFLPLVLNDKKVASHKVKASFYSCLLIVCLPSESRTLNWDLEPPMLM